MILTDNTAASLARLQSEVPEFGEPSHEGHADNDVHWALWPLDDCEWGLEVACVDPNQSSDTMPVILFVVDDLDASIDRIGADNLTEVSLYSDRRIVDIKPQTGVTPGISLIAKA